MDVVRASLGPAGAMDEATALGAVVALSRLNIDCAYCTIPPNQLHIHPPSHLLTSHKSSALCLSNSQSWYVIYFLTLLAQPYCVVR